MRAHRAVPVAAAALVFALMAIGPSAAQNQQPTWQEGGVPGRGAIGVAATPPAVPAKKPAPPSDTPSPSAKRSLPPTASATSRSDPVTPEVRAIVALAKQVNGPAFERALDEPEPRKLDPTDTFDLTLSYWNSSSAMWSGLLDRFRLKGELPAFRLLAYNESVEDREVTGCARLNNGKEVVSSSDRALYCPADSKNGTIYWPVREFEKRWKASELPDSAVSRGLVIQMSQLLGEFLAVRIHETYSGMAAAAEIPLPMQPDTAAVGYCFAGTALQGRYLDRDTALAGLVLLHPQPTGSAKEFARALAFGFDTNSLGKCMVEFWPRPS